MQQTHLRPAHGSRLPALLPFSPSANFARRTRGGIDVTLSILAACTPFVWWPESRKIRGNEWRRNERRERERMARDAQSHLTILLPSSFQELYNLGYVASQARYILQYIQTFTVDTLTIFQTVATGQRQAFQQRRAFLRDPCVRWDLQLLFDYYQLQSRHAY